MDPMRNASFRKPVEQVATALSASSPAEGVRWHQFARRLVRPALASSAFTLAGVGVGLLHPWPLKIAVDSLSTGTWMGLRGAPSIAAVMAAFSLVLVLVGAGLDYGGALISGRAAERAAAAMRSRVLRRLLHMPMPFFDRYSSGELLSRLNGDVDRVQDGMMRVVMTTLPHAATLVGMTVVMLLIDPLLALVGLAAAPLLGTMTVVKRKRTDRLQRVSRQRQGQLQSAASDLLRNARAIQGLGAEPWAIGRYEQRADQRGGCNDQEPRVLSAGGSRRRPDPGGRLRRGAVARGRAGVLGPALGRQSAGRVQLPQRALLACARAGEARRCDGSNGGEQGPAGRHPQPPVAARTASRSRRARREWSVGPRTVLRLRERTVGPRRRDLSGTPTRARVHHRSERGGQDHVAASPGAALRAHPRRRRDRWRRRS